MILYALSPPVGAAIIALLAGSPAPAGDHLAAAGAPAVTRAGAAPSREEVRAGRGDEHARQEVADGQPLDAQQIEPDRADEQAAR